MNTLVRLAKWFHSQCDGDWEHGEGIRIATLDNPGWCVDITLEGTDLEERPYQAIEYNRSKQDWIFCLVRDGRFVIRCGPLNLEEGLNQFLNWADPKVY